MVLVAGLAVIVFVLLPHVISRREAITQSREFDRFSPHMRVLRTDGSDHTHGECRPTEMRLLPAAVPHAELPGAAMPTNTERTRREGARTRTGEDTPARQIAQLRARRAARLANERAAAQRRMVATVLAALLAGLFVVLAAVGTLGWAWTLIPVAALVSAVVGSRMAAVRTERVERVEESRMAELRAARRAGVTRAGHLAAPTVLAARDAADRGERFEASGARRVAPSEEVHAEAETGVPSTQSHVAEPVAAESSTSAVASEHIEARPDASDSGVDTDSDRGRTEAPEQPKRTWTPTPVPAPTWSNRVRVEGRIVHADTDLRGIPRVGAAPARPTVTEGMPEGSRSTEQVVAAQPIAFDLDEVLENRRAE